VKTLAKDTSEATEEIRRRVEAILSSTRQTVEEIGGIRGAVGHIRTSAAGLSDMSGALDRTLATFRIA